MNYYRFSQQFAVRCIFASNALLASFVPLLKRAFQYFIMRSPPPSLTVSSIILHDEDSAKDLAVRA